VKAEAADYLGNAHHCLARGSLPTDPITLLVTPAKAGAYFSHGSRLCAGMTKMEDGGF
jgi:hypothetical protein